MRQFIMRGVSVRLVSATHDKAKPKGGSPPKGSKKAMTPCQHACFLLCAVLLFFAGLSPFPPGEARAEDNEVADMIIELLRGSDNDMRMLAIQQIREAAPGKDATRRFADLLPTLTPDVQALLIEALGERDDATARPAILTMLDSDTEAIRVATTRALSRLASPDDLPVLARMAATGSNAEKEAARYSLRQVRGKEMNTVMIDILTNADAKRKIELIAALTDRNAKEALPVALKSKDDADLAVRLAVLDALRVMADENHTTFLVKRFKSSTDKSERKQAELALLATCRRERTKCADAVIAGFDGADAATCMSLMHALALAGGPESLNVVVALLEDEDQDVRGEAVRVLAGWSDPAAIAHLKKLAYDVKDLRNHVLAMRGIVRLASPGKDRPADFATLSEALKLAMRKEEKVLALGALGTVPTPESLVLAASCLDQPEIAEDAALAAVLIAEKIGKDNTNQVRTAMQKVIETVQSETTRDRAKKILETRPQATMTR
ncbi:MAG: HEAT repeat domain-containing protein [Sedimentisphaerales bacterium]|nr:HEAT repeat domain-containing protein [Sedimentisphaerales bacterium]